MKQPTASQLTFKDKHSGSGTTLGAKVSDMWYATWVVINTTSRVCTPPPSGAAHVSHSPATQWSTPIELNFGTVVVVRIRGWFCRPRFVQLRLNWQYLPGRLLVLLQTVCEYWVACAFSVGNTGAAAAKVISAKHLTCVRMQNWFVCIVSNSIICTFILHRTVAISFT